MKERRHHCRVSGAMVSDTAVRIRPGHEGALLNMSRAGALIEIRRPIAPGVHVDIQLARADERRSIRALVLRCSVRTIAALDGVTYETALLFEDEVVLDSERDALNGYLVHGGPDVSTVLHGSELPGFLDAFGVVTHGSLK